MFDLIYRDGAAENVGHYVGVLTDGSSKYRLGQLVYLDGSGKAKLCGGATNTEKPYGIIAERFIDGTDRDFVRVLALDSDTVFRCPIVGTSVKNAFIGQRLAISDADFGSVISAQSSLSGDYVGATVCDVLDASEDGDLIDVRFEV